MRAGKVFEARDHVGTVSGKALAAVRKRRFTRQIPMWKNVNSGFGSCFGKCPVLRALGVDCPVKHANSRKYRAEFPIAFARQF
jgi:hypothetical protein